MSSPSARRALASAVLVCVVGAGLALLAVTRTWFTTLTRRPAPLPPVPTGHSGSSSLGWLVAVALVALAGAGALLATRGMVRVGVGALLGLVGLVIFGGGLDGLHLASGARLFWPVLVMAGGALVAYTGLQAMRHGPAWPAMGAKYEAPVAASSSREPRGWSAADAADAPINPSVSGTSMWDDLDRGIDPTAQD